MPTSDWADMSTWSSGESLQEPGICMHIRNGYGEAVYMVWDSDYSDNVSVAMEYPAEEWRAISDADIPSDTRCAMPLPIEA